VTNVTGNETPMPLLLVDDDQELAALLGEYLTREGYAVETVRDGNAGLARAQTAAHALVILDVMLPGRDGFEVLRELRKTSLLPVIMLTAKGEEVDRVLGLELGADDYLSKPFSPRELLARIRAVLRRKTAPSSHPAAGTGVLRCGTLTVDSDAHTAWLEGDELPLTAIEFALLREFVSAPGRVLTRDFLLDRVRGRSYDLFDRSIDVHISHLRHKLADDPRQPQFIKTVRSVGYMFVGEVPR
jgi:two-component system phosphate regulon response regulator OmpR